MNAKSRPAVLALLSLLWIACAPSGEAPQEADSLPSMDQLSERYVRLILAIGQHDEHYVDAYYGPPEWRPEEGSSAPPLAELRSRGQELIAAIDGSPVAGGEEEIVRLRRVFLRRQLEAAVARIEMLEGESMTFDEESRALYDAVAPTNDEAAFLGLQDRLSALLPGSGSLSERLEAFRAGFVIPPDRLDSVFTAAIDECRRRTLEHVALPVGESFRVEYVTDQPWSAYNWYQGDSQSLIQVNTDLPIYIDRAIDLACHEGYPGHHVYNALLEKHLVRDRGWQEFSVYPLFSPQSLIAEGSANFGIQVAFPGEERLEFERDVLFPLAGIDPQRAKAYEEVQEILKGLRYAGNEAARAYLDGRMDAAQAADWLERYALSPRDRAEQRVRFFDRYRSYVINYNLGEDLVAHYVETTAGPDADRDERWRVFSELLSTPRLPSGLTSAP